MRFMSNLLIAVLPGLMSLPAYADDYDFTPGLWESNVTIEFTGLPEQMTGMLNMPMKTQKGCLKENDLVFKQDNKCTYEKIRVNKNKMKINITCNTPEGVTKGTGEVNFNNKSSSGWIEMSVAKGPMGSMTMKSTFNSRYIGPCQ